MPGAPGDCRRAHCPRRAWCSVGIGYLDGLMQAEDREPRVQGMDRAREREHPAPGARRAPPRATGRWSGAQRLARSLFGRGPRPAIKLLTLAVTLLFSYIALSGVHLAQAWHALGASNYLWLAPALVALGLALTARALRWRSLFAPARRPPLGSVYDAMMVGYLYNNILPARSGEVARVFVLTRRSNAQPVEIIGTTVLERLFDIVGLLLIFFLAQPWLPAVSWFHTAAVVAAALAATVAVAAVILAVYGDRALRLLLRPLERLPFLSNQHIEHAATELAHGLSALRYPGVAFLGLLWTLLAWLLSAVMAYFVSLAFHLHLPFACSVLVTVTVGLAMILPAPPAAIGVFEGAVLIAMKAYGLTQSAALPYALILHLANFVPFIVVGVLLLRFNSRHPPLPSEGAATLAARSPQPAAGAPPAGLLASQRETPQPSSVV